MERPVADSPHSAGSAKSAGSDAPARYIQKRTRDSLHIIRALGWVAVAFVVCLLVGHLRGREKSYEFLAGYFVEYSLSVDNLVVFLVVFKYFQVPPVAQERCLYWGIIGAMAFRGIFIVSGSYAFTRFKWLNVVFGLILVYSAVKVIREDDDEEEDLSDNMVVKVGRKLLGARLDADYHGGLFVFRSPDNGRLTFTPLALVLFTIEVSDIIFAVDSIPAVLSLTHDTTVVYTSNICAILGLRSLFVLIVEALGSLPYLKYSAAAVLFFVGVKMCAEFFGFEIDRLVSLGVIVCSIVAGVGASVCCKKPESTNEDEQEMVEKDEENID